VVESMISLLRDRVARDGAGVIAIDAGVTDPRRVTCNEFMARVAALRQDLAGRGTAPGDCIGVWLPNWSDSLVWQFAAVSLGAHVIGINTRYNVEEVAHLLQRAQPKVVAIAHDFVKLDLRARLFKAFALCGGHAPSVAVIAGPHAAPVGAAALREYDLGQGAWTPRGAAAGAATDFLDRPESLAVAFTTSGSTGEPKLAGHTSNAVARHAIAASAAGNWKAGDVTLCALPLTGVFAFVPAMATIASGGTCLLEPSFNAAVIAQNMERFGVTHVIGADDIVSQIAEQLKQQQTSLPRWRRLLLADFHGRSVELAEWAERQFGLAATGVYGSSELFALAAVWPESVPAPQRWRGGGALASPAMEVRCADPETGRPSTAGESGELQFRGYNVVDAYLGAPTLRAEQFTADGWFRTGDLGVLRGDGAFEFVCRAGDSLRLKGFLVEPAEIESRIAAHAAVDLTKVVGLQLPDGATEAVAFVVLKPGASATGDELKNWCSAGLARHKVPRNVHIVLEMPTTSGVNGTKIKAAELRAWAAQLEAASKT
jgi:acyl-CoA synthetase (AMP-forming)/AMP-acid ligase II